MRLAIHAGTLRGFGSGIVGRAILDALRACADVDAMLAIVPTEWPEDSWPTASTSATATLDTHRIRPGIRSKFIGENVTLRRLLRTWRADALLSLTDTSLVACPVPHVLMVQQAFIAYPPSELTFTVPASTRRRFRTMAGYLRCALPHVDRVTVQTEHMKAAFCRRWRYPAEHVTVIPSTVQSAALDVQQVAQTPLEDPPTLAYVSGPGPHKNHQVLAPMMAALAVDKPTLRCLVTAQRDQVPALVAAATRLQVLDRFEFSGNLEAGDAMRRLQRASVAVLPSHIESFGIPYHEALALGVPTVASDVPCAREALGAAGHYAPPSDGEAWADAVRRVLAERDTLSHEARERFTANAWTWERIAAAYVALVTEAMGRR